MFLGERRTGDTGGGGGVLEEMRPKGLLVKPLPALKGLVAALLIKPVFAGDRTGVAGRLARGWPPSSSAPALLSLSLFVFSSVFFLLFIN